MSEYNYKYIEQKWQLAWEARGDYRADLRSSKEKCYLLIEFPYPSGAGLHVGHPRSYVAMDVVARKRRMQGKEVLFPIGFDAFGLPAENYAIKTGVHPRVTTEQNIANFRRQLKMLGLSFDWSKEVNTTDPGYYKWTQWMFLRMFKAGLAYKAAMPINWCPSCSTALANEEVEGGVCERCGSTVVRRQKEQWMLRITKYADRLAADLDTVDYIPPVVEQQRNWIGRSEGAEVSFPLLGTEEKLTVFTTRPDTLFGVTYLVIAPEHGLISRCAHLITNLDEVCAYQHMAAGKSDLQRSEASKDKSGVRLEGIHALHPVTGEPLPVWTSDYVLMGYGHGAVMAVPGHDSRDWAFAKAYGLPIVEVVRGGDIEKEAFEDTATGTLCNSDFLDGLPVNDAISCMTTWLEENGKGNSTVSYHLRDWIFSRQRYWGEPIPLVNCPSCGWVPLPESELPLVLPDVKEFRPSGDGVSPLAAVRDWVETTCPCCGGAAERETDTMPQWAGSCWYFLRYLDPDNSEAFAAPDLLRRWMPVDWYNGGMEHTTLHLLYSRFWHKFLFDEGVVPTSEPYRRRTSHGMILGADYEKMSKSRGNVVNPDDVVDQFGADSFRIYEMFLGEFDKTAVWNDQGLVGCHRFLKRVWALSEKATQSVAMTADEKRLMARTIRDVSERTERMKFNTAVSAMMEYVNALFGLSEISVQLVETLCQLLFPYAPHIAEEVWNKLGHNTPLVAQPWPVPDQEYLEDTMFTMAIQVNGKLRDTVEVPLGASQQELTEICLARPAISSRVSLEELKRVVYVPRKIMNFIVPSTK